MYNLDILIKKYVEKFNENVPTFLCRHMSDEELKDAIQKCIDDNKPMKIEVDKENDY